MIERVPLSPALLVSLLLHVFLAAVFVVAGTGRGPLVDPSRGAAWTGDTFDIDEIVRAPATTAAAKLPLPATPTPPPAAEPKTEAKAPAPKSERLAKAPKPASTESTPAPSAPPASSGESGRPRAGSLGEAPGVANLAKAFARAVTAATHRDKVWEELPVGSAGSFEVVITLGDDGSITESVLKDKTEVPAHLVKLLDRTLLLLKAGRFALSRADSTHGSEKLRVEVTLSAGTPDEDAEDPLHTLNMGFEPPLPDKAGRAYFDHASGRHFEAKITILPR
jgi:hypothetical protein